MSSRMRWKKTPRETGLVSIGSVPRGSIYHDGEKQFASVSPLGGGWRGHVRGWYFVAGWDSNLPYHNTCNAPAASEDEAKRQAEAYVAEHLGVS